MSLNLIIFAKCFEVLGDISVHCCIFMTQIKTKAFLGRGRALINYII